MGRIGCWGGGDNGEVRMKSKKLKSILKGIRAFCSYLFMLQLRPKDYDVRRCALY